VARRFLCTTPFPHYSDLKAVGFKVEKSYQFCATIFYGRKPQAE